MWPILALAAGQAAYNQFVEKPRIDEYNRRQGEVAATQTQFSPWTKSGPGKADYQMAPTAAGGALQGAATGASFMQAYDQAQTSKAMAQDQLKTNEAMRGYYTGGGQQAPQQPSFSAWNRPKNQFGNAV